MLQLGKYFFLTGEKYFPSYEKFAAVRRNNFFCAQAQIPALASLTEDPALNFILHTSQMTLNRLIYSE